MLDALSAGRIEVPFLTGTPNEQKTDDTPGDLTKPMTQAGIDLILKAWKTTEPFSWEGEQYKFSTVALWPKITQRPHPPVFGSGRSEEHTSELQSLMRISYAVFCLKTKTAIQVEITGPY